MHRLELANAAKKAKRPEEVDPEAGNPTAEDPGLKNAIACCPSGPLSFFSMRHGPMCVTDPACRHVGQRSCGRDRLLFRRSERCPRRLRLQPAGARSVDDKLSTSLDGRKAIVVHAWADSEQELDSRQKKLFAGGRGSISSVSFHE